MLRKLAGFEQLNLERLEDPRIGDVAFVEAGKVSVLFARDRYVGLIRSIGLQAISIIDLALRVDQFIVST